MVLVLAAILIAFLTGIGVGWTWRESVELLLGRDDPTMMMNRTRATAHAVFAHRTEVATWAVVLAIMVGTLLGVGVAYTHSDVRQIANDARHSSHCQQVYNKRSAHARDDRAAAQLLVLKAAIKNVRADTRGWKGIAKTLTSTSGTLDELVLAINHRVAKDQAYLRTLVHQLHVSRLHRYPPANFCTRKGHP